MENLGKTGDPQQRLDAAEACLWTGDVDGAIELFRDGQHPQVRNFIVYLNRHRHRIVNYSYYQAVSIVAANSLKIPKQNVVIAMR